MKTAAKYKEKQNKKYEEWQQQYNKMRVGTGASGSGSALADSMHPTVSLIDAPGSALAGPTMSLIEAPNSVKLSENFAAGTYDRQWQASAGADDRQWQWQAPGQWSTQQWSTQQWSTQQWSTQQWWS